MTKAKNLKVSVIIAAAGKGERAGMGRNKLLAPIYGAPVLWHTLEKFYMPDIDEVIVASSEYDFKEISALASPFGYKTVFGGETRSESVKNALKEVSGDITLVHDGARPFVSRKLILECIYAVKRFGSAVCALPVTDTVAYVHYGLINHIPDRSAMYVLQTPQAFLTEDLRRAYSLAEGGNFTDDSSVVKQFIGPPHIIAGEAENIKLTFAADFERPRPPVFAAIGERAGFGVDVHAFGEGDFVTLGGVKIDCDGALIAHSDGDVVFHAITDAILSAAGLKDIGHYFPDTDDRWKNADSAQMCGDAALSARKEGFAPLSVSVSVQAEKPRLAPHTDKMKENIARALGMDENSVAVAAGTCEHLGFVGRGTGIAAYAYVLMKKIGC